MAAVRLYLLTIPNYFPADISRHREAYIYKVSTKFLQWFRRRCDNGENQRWLPVAIFVDRPKQFSGMHNKTTRGIFKKSDQWSRRKCDNEIVTVLSNGQKLAILKMAAVLSYLLMDLNRFQADTSRH